jgi:hypothetical protein
MAPIIGFAAAIAILALLFALTEIQIEGGEGWAAGLPTWRIQNRWTRWFFAARPMTGYHCYMLMFVISFAHLHFAAGMTAWSWPLECRTISFLMFFFILEDFLWFALNPAYGLKKFRKEHIWWHQATWWWIMPRDYWLCPPLAGVLYWISLAFSKPCP